ncbi:hypothetical protein K2F54_00990 [Cryobacterium sp. 1639]|uniref:hypothetical protein n=1 Tax=Cryobacterium inferilacus TaxID=2866629 RepID=UPI001C72CD33|nr:hypothetical protein [Cryobacterium sp. 1639]MBX0298545.1 hypothetical protein [Cryobacterium sp. 1639]
MTEGQPTTGRRSARGTADTIPTDRQEQDRRFRRTLATLLVGLLVVCLGLVAVNVLNGPRLTGSTVDTAAVVSKANQRLVLDTNQQLNDVSADQVTVTPASAVSVQTSNDTLVIVFSQPLDYDTEYTVDVTGVTGPFAERVSTLSTSFRTDESPMYVLTRAPAMPGAATKDPDRIVRTAVGTAETTEVFTAPYIQAFVPTGDELVVVTLADDLTSRLNLVATDGSSAELTLPGTGTVQNLQASRVSATVGFTFSSVPGAPGTVYDNTLFLLDLTQGTLATVDGLDGEPVQAISWGFMPNRAELVAQVFDTTLLLVDPRTDDAPIPIGQFPNLNAFAPDGVRIAVSDQERQYVLDLSTGTENAIEAQDVAGTTPYTAELHFLTGGEGYVQRVAEFDQATGRIVQYLTLVTGAAGAESSRVVYEPALANETIVGFSLSPNDQYLAIQTVPNSDTQVSDEYPVDPQATTTTTVFVELDSGAITRSIVGIDATW